jgi:hypothetical protein
MAIPNIANINVGLPNESAGSDSLYTAFVKTRDNFNTISACASPYNTFTGNGVSIVQDANAGSVGITNTGVTSIVAGTGVSISSSNGAVTISSNGGGNGGSGTVTSVGIQSPNSTLNVSGTIVSAGLLNVDLSSVAGVSGTYRAPNVTVDTYGRITSISNGSVGITSLSILPGSGIAVTGSPATNSISNITVTNTGVTRLNAGTGIALSGSNGSVTVGLAAAIGSVTLVNISSNTLLVSGSPITSSGTITVNLPSNISVSGNITAANVSTSTITATGNIQGGNLRTTGLLSVGGNANIGNLGVTGVIATTLSAIGNANVGNIGATNGVFTNVSGNGSGLSAIPGANITGTVANANFASTAGSAITAGTVTTAAQPNITSVGTLTLLSVLGQATAGNMSATNGVFTNVSGNGSGLSAIPGANITGTVANANFASTAGSAITAGTVTTAAQPNITSVGTLSSLSVSGNANVGTIISTQGEIESLKSFWINRDDSSLEGGQITFRKAVDNTDAWALDVYGNTSNTQFRIIDSATGIAKLTIDKTFPGNLSTPNDVSIGNPVVIGSVNNIRKITAGIFQTSSGTAIAPTSPNSNPLFTMDLSAVGFFSKWLITVMPGFATTDNNLVNWLTATFELAVVVNVTGPTYTFSKLTNNVNFINLEFTFDSVTLTTKITNSIGGMDVGDYPVLWSALRLI